MYLYQLLLHCFYICYKTHEATFLTFILCWHKMATFQVADLGSGAFLTPGSRIRNRFFPDLGSQTHIFESSVTIVWVINSIILQKLAQIFFITSAKLTNFQFWENCVYLKRYDNKFFCTPLFCCCFWIWDPGSGMGKNQDQGSGINIPDPQHWFQYNNCVNLFLHGPAMHELVRCTSPTCRSVSKFMHQSLNRGIMLILRKKKLDDNTSKSSQQHQGWGWRLD